MFSESGVPVSAALVVPIFMHAFLLVGNHTPVCKYTRGQPETAPLWVPGIPALVCRVTGQQAFHRGAGSLWVRQIHLCGGFFPLHSSPEIERQTDICCSWTCPDQNQTHNLLLHSMTLQRTKPPGQIDLPFGSCQIIN